MSHHDITVPRWVLWSAAAMIVLSVGLAAGARQARLAAPPAPAAAPPLEVASLHFSDRADGSILIVDAATNQQVGALEAGTNGFVRGVLRGMTRSRRLASIGKEAPFRLAREADGLLTLEDPETGRRVDLISFGPDNVAAFAKILGLARAARATVKEARR